MTRGLLLALCGSLSLCLMLTAAACGGDGDAQAASTTPGVASPTQGSAPASSGKLLDGPAGKYSLLHEDVGTGYITDIKGTYVLTADSYGGTSVFPSASEGTQLLQEWGYTGGYETAMVPEGRDQAVLNGAYAMNMEIHLFKDVAGAKSFYAYAEKKVKENPKAQPIRTGAAVGDEYAVYRAVEGKIASSTVDRAVHYVQLRRGNLVAIVLTIGADPFMKADTVVALAKMIDEKALGSRAAIDPTPTSNYTPPAYSNTPSRAYSGTPSPTPKGR